MNAVCQNTLGSYLCSCKAGFAGDGKTCSCKDIVNCNLFNLSGNGEGREKDEKETTQTFLKISVKPWQWFIDMQVVRKVDQQLGLGVNSSLFSLFRVVVPSMFLKIFRISSLVCLFACLLVWVFTIFFFFFFFFFLPATF